MIGLIFTTFIVSVGVAFLWAVLIAFCITVSVVLISLCIGALVTSTIINQFKTSISIIIHVVLIFGIAAYYGVLPSIITDMIERPMILLTFVPFIFIGLFYLTVYKILKGEEKEMKMTQYEINDKVMEMLLDAKNEKDLKVANDFYIEVINEIDYDLRMKLNGAFLEVRDELEQQLNSLKFITGSN